MANSHIRANAATLMLDAFPLLDPGLCRQEVDAQLQQQFDLIRVGLLGRGVFVPLSTLEKGCDDTPCLA